MTQEISDDDPIKAYWSHYGRDDRKMWNSHRAISPREQFGLRGGVKVENMLERDMRNPLYAEGVREALERHAKYELTINPWANGDYAFLGIVCGLLFMLIVSVGVSL
jgi:hypothetical protein